MKVALVAKPQQTVVEVDEEHPDQHHEQGRGEQVQHRDGSQLGSEEMILGKVGTRYQDKTLKDREVHDTHELLATGMTDDSPEGVEQPCSKN